MSASENAPAPTDAQLLALLHGEPYRDQENASWDDENMFSFARRAIAAFAPPTAENAPAPTEPPDMDALVDHALEAAGWELTGNLRVDLLAPRIAREAIRAALATPQAQSGRAQAPTEPLSDLRKRIAEWPVFEGPMGNRFISRDAVFAAIDEAVRRLS